MPAPSALSPRLAYERPHWSTKLDRLEISSWLLCEAFGRTFFLPCGRKARGSETPCDPLFMFWLSNTGIITRLCSLKLIWGEASLSLSSTVSFLVCHGGSAAESCRKLQNGVWHPGVVAYTFKPSTQEAEADLYELEASLVSQGHTEKPCLWMDGRMDVLLRQLRAVYESDEKRFPGHRLSTQVRVISLAAGF